MTAEDRLKMVIGNLVAEKCVLDAQVENLKARIAELEKAMPQGDKAED